jgi:hypothetical protein
MMVAWWKRILLSLLSVVVATIVCFAGMVVYSSLKSHPVSFHSSEVVLTVAVTVGFCVIAWIFSVPVVLLIRNVSGLRFWLYWVLGSCLGPVLVLALSAIIFTVYPQNAALFKSAVRPLVYGSAAISSLTSLFYLSLLRGAQKSAAARALKARPAQVRADDGLTPQ